jgi:hypothetical protein
MKVYFAPGISSGGFQENRLAALTPLEEVQVRRIHNDGTLKGRAKTKTNTDVGVTRRQDVL